MTGNAEGAPAAAPAPPRRRLPAPLAWALKALIAAACIAYVVHKVPWSGVGPALARCRWELIVLAVALQYAVAVANAARWRLLARGTPDLPLHKFLYFVLLGQFTNLFMPTYVAAEAVKVFAFGRKYGGTQENIGIALLSRTVGMAVQGLMAGVGFALYARELRDRGVFAQARLDGATLAIGLAALAALAATAFWFRQGLKAQIWFRTILSIARDRRLLSGTVAWTLAIQLLASASSYCLFLSLWPDTRFWEVVLFTTLILAALSLPFGFGGVGVREYLNLLFFTQVGGIPAHITFAVNIVGYAPVLAVSLTGGAWMAFRRLRP